MAVTSWPKQMFDQMEIVSRTDHNVFEDFACTGAPAVTLSRGRIAWANGELPAEQGDRHYVERPQFSPVHVANSTWKHWTAPQAMRPGVVP